MSLRSFPHSAPGRHLLHQPPACRQRLLIQQFIRHIRHFTPPVDITVQQLTPRVLQQRRQTQRIELAEPRLHRSRTTIPMILLTIARRSRRTALVVRRGREPLTSPSPPRWGMLPRSARHLVGRPCARGRLRQPCSGRLAPVRLRAYVTPLTALPRSILSGRGRTRAIRVTS